MTLRSSHAGTLPAALALVLSAAPPVSAQVDSNITLTVPPKRPLRVALTEAVRIRRVGQPVTATLVEAVYAYDRVVLPVGTEVTGQVARLDSPTRMNRTRALLSGDLSPHRIVVLQFDAVIRNGERMPVETVVRGGVPRVKRQFARSVEQENESAAGGKRRVKDAAANAVALMKQRARDTIATVRLPRRLKLALEMLATRRRNLTPGIVGDASIVGGSVGCAKTTSGATRRHSPSNCSRWSQRRRLRHFPTAPGSPGSSRR